MQLEVGRLLGFVVFEGDGYWALGVDIFFPKAIHHDVVHVRIQAFYRIAHEFVALELQNLVGYVGGVILAQTVQVGPATSHRVFNHDRSGTGIGEWNLRILVVCPTTKDGDG